ENHRELISDLSDRRTERVASRSGGRMLPESEQLGDGRTMQITREGAGPVVTLFEEYGSGVGAIGPRVAERLGVPYIEQAFTSRQIARDMPDTIRTPGAWQRFLRSVSLDATPDSDLARAYQASDEHQMVRENTTHV